MMNFQKSYFTVFKISIKMQNLTVITVNTLKNVIFERSITKFFFSQEICSSGGKQTIHRVSATSVVNDCHPPTSLMYLENYHTY